MKSIKHIIYFILLQLHILYILVKHRICDLFCDKTQCPRGVYMQSGELLVSGKNKVDIELKHHPDKVAVSFDDDCVITPCDQVFDFLEYEINKKHHKVILTINWNVSGLRKIIWEVYY